MTARLTPATTHFELIKPLINFAHFSEKGIDPTLAELIKIRASQINGCARCLQMHTHDARQRGETEQRLYLLDAWRDSSLYTARERAALSWTEALTRLGAGGVPDDVYANLKAHFSEEEQIKITLLIGAINAFNRVNVGFRIGDSVAAGDPVAAGRSAA